MANPYDIEFLNRLIGQQETQRLEFKSSRAWPVDNQQRNKFISGQLVPTVSAFLNTGGGQLIIGIEDKDGVAVALSPGVPRDRMKWEQLQSAICDRIQPAVANHVSVFSIRVDTNSDGKELFAFVADVRPGPTAYQADDKKYYVRRSGQTEAMEDKDIRLRMLAGDKPRFEISIHPNIVPRCDNFSGFVQNVTFKLRFQNVGIRNIPRAIVHTHLNQEGLSESGGQAIFSQTQKHRESDFPIEGVEARGLFPGQCFDLKLLSVYQSVFYDCADPTAVKLTADVVVYVDDGLPVELRNYDLMVHVRPLIENKWTVPEA